MSIHWKNIIKYNKYFSNYFLNFKVIWNVFLTNGSCKLCIVTHARYIISLNVKVYHDKSFTIINKLGLEHLFIKYIPNVCLIIDSKCQTVKIENQQNVYSKSKCTKSEYSMNICAFTKCIVWFHIKSYNQCKSDKISTVTKMTCQTSKISVFQNEGINVCSISQIYSYLTKRLSESCKYESKVDHYCLRVYNYHFILLNANRHYHYNDALRIIFKITRLFKHVIDCLYNTVNIMWLNNNVNSSKTSGIINICATHVWSINVTNKTKKPMVPSGISNICATNIARLTNMKHTNKKLMVPRGIVLVYQNNKCNSFYKFDLCININTYFYLFSDYLSNFLHNSINCVINKCLNIYNSELLLYQMDDHFSNYFIFFENISQNSDHLTQRLKFIMQFENSKLEIVGITLVPSNIYLINETEMTHYSCYELFYNFSKYISSIYKYMLFLINRDIWTQFNYTNGDYNFCFMLESQFKHNIVQNNARSLVDFRYYMCQSRSVVLKRFLSKEIRQHDDDRYVRRCILRKIWYMSKLTIFYLTIKLHNHKGNNNISSKLIRNPLSTYVLIKLFKLNPIICTMSKNFDLHSGAKLFCVAGHQFRQVLGTPTFQYFCVAGQQLRQVHGTPTFKHMHLKDVSMHMVHIEYVTPGTNNKRPHVSVNRHVTCFIHKKVCKLYQDNSNYLNNTIVMVLLNRILSIVQNYNVTDTYLDNFICLDQNSVSKV